MRLRLTVVGALAGLALGPLVAAGPASAHSADAPTATDSRVTVLAVTPPMPGLTIRTIEAGARLELVNHTSHTIEVLGYSGEPYLRIGPDGVYQNDASPATYLNETLAGGVAPPPTAGSAMPPLWTKLSATPAVLWHDHRTQATVPEATSGPGVRRVLTWSVPLRDGVRDFTVTGTLDAVPPPSAPTWWAACLLLAAGVAPLGLRRDLRTVAVASVAAGLAGVLYAVGAALDSGALEVAGVLRVMVAQQTWPLVCGLAAVAAGAYAWLRRPAADLALGLAGACAAIFAGIGNAAVFAHAVTPLTWPGTLARLLVLTATAAGTGTVAATILHARRTRTRRPAPQPEILDASGPSGGRNRPRFSLDSASPPRRARREPA